MAALIDAGQAADSGYEVSLVLSNIEDAGGLAIASAKGVATVSIPHKPFGKDREAHERAVDEALRAAGVEVVALAGYMRILTPWLVRAWEGRMLNIHPSLLPAFGGKGYWGHHVHQAVLDRGCQVTGCTVHVVDNEYDHGPILLQRVVPVDAGMSPDELAARVFEAECLALPDAVAQHVARVRG